MKYSFLFKRDKDIYTFTTKFTYSPTCSCIGNYLFVYKSAYLFPSNKKRLYIRHLCSIISIY